MVDMNFQNLEQQCSLSQGDKVEARVQVVLHNP